jgi:hypothetical protein
MSQHGGGPAAGLQEAGEHLQGGGFACPIRAKESHELSWRDFKIHSRNGRHLLVAPMKKASESTSKPRFFLKDAVHFFESAGEDCWSHS